MYISLEQLRVSLKELDPVHPFFGVSFLAFKQLNLEVSILSSVDIADQEEAILNTYYNPLPDSEYYYIPLRTTGRKNRWVSKRKYPDSGLQKTRTSTFKEAFLHPIKSDEWAWASDYLTTLADLQHNIKVPVFHLAVWMLRERNWPNGTQPKDIIDSFLTMFRISTDETNVLFDTSFDEPLLSTPMFQKEKITWRSLRELIGTPPDVLPEEGGGLESLELIGVGPAKDIELDFAQRLNIITGDNGLGKTFLLECAWWALSGYWADPEQPAYPRPDSAKPAIRFQISGGPNRPKTVHFNKLTQMWPLPDERRPVLPGIIIYARIDGSCMIWDPAKHYWSAGSDRARGLETSEAIRLTQNNIWDGLEVELRSGKKQFICNGLVRDWMTWQFRPSTDIFDTFSRVLQKLSPQPNEITLVPGKPTKLPRDDREMPTLKLPYGDVPITLLSEGIKRILSLAYLLVWTWETHKEASKNIGKPLQSKLVFIIDEMEAHLHPRWQRIIVPALLDVVKEIEKRLEIQLIIATHSPLVMASIEPIFDEEIDALFTLDLVNEELEAKEIPYVKHGSINSWLTSEVFDLERAYSVDAERALIAAKNLQLSDSPDPAKVKEISNLLIEHLPAIDPFWPRWKHFADKYITME